MAIARNQHLTHTGQNLPDETSYLMHLHQHVMAELSVGANVRHSCQRQRLNDDISTPDGVAFRKNTARMQCDLV